MPIIRCLLIQITLNRRGQSIREERLVAGEELRIGRGTDSNVYLPDPRIRFLHAVIKNSADGKLHIDGEGVPLNINGALETSAKLRYGARVMVGPYEINIEAPYFDSKLGEHDFVLTTELVQPLVDVKTEIKMHSKTSLRATSLSKRQLALVLSVLVGVVFMVLPVIKAVKPAWLGGVAHWPIGADESWNPGTLSAAHQSFGKQCNECHELPFQHVQDTACKNCHRTIGAHVAANGLQQAMFGQVRCAECHREHKGLQGLVRSDSSLCVDCHGGIKAKNVDTKLADIHDFATDHPPFALTFKTGPMPTDVQRLTQTDTTKLTEKSGLKFPHEMHLADTGVKGPDGRVVMECKNCHTPDEAGVRFKPVSMQAHCQQCHRLEFEPAITSRQAPHAPVQQLLTMLREFYAGVALGQTRIDVVSDNGLLRRPGQSSVNITQTRAADWARAQADRIAAELIEVRACNACHVVERNADNAEVPWKIAAVNQTTHWITRGRFEHFQHNSYDCVACHDVKHSTSSSDVSIPDIRKCQTCHSGAQPVRNKVVSNCESCHGFHLGDHRSGNPHEAGIVQTAAHPVVNAAANSSVATP